MCGDRSFIARLERVEQRQHVGSAHADTVSGPGYESELDATLRIFDREELFVTMLVDRHGDTEERLASMLFRNVEARLAEFLVKAAARWGIPEPRGVLIAAPFTHQEMASMIGSTRETVTLTLGELRKKGVIDIDRRRIVVLDRDALKSRI